MTPGEVVPLANTEWARGKLRIDQFVGGALGSTGEYGAAIPGKKAATDPTAVEVV